MRRDGRGSGEKRKDRAVQCDLSQIATHTVYGGVVPEIASREHIKAVNYVIERALAEAQVALEDITAIGVTYGPVW